MPEEVIAPTYPAEGSREMMDAGVFYGRMKNKTNPKMRQFILANRGGIEIVNLQKTEELLAGAEAFVKEKVKNNGLVLIVGTQPAAQSTLLSVAKKFNFPYVIGRWVGGAITNFGIVAKRVEYLKKLRTDFASGALEKYTKKERLELEREMRRLEELMGGLENMNRQPDLVIIIDPILHRTAVREAIMRKIPIVALANVDADPDEIDYIVPGNDKARKSIEWFLGKMEQAIAVGIKERVVPTAEPTNTIPTNNEQKR
jgi:small subunit ribosomal protein S2